MMRIILFLNKDLEANLAYHLLKRELARHSVRIYYSNTVGNPNSKPKELCELEKFEKGFFFGQVASLFEAAGVNTNFEFFGGRFSSVPMSECLDVNSESFIDEVKSFDPDLFIAIRFGKIFKPPIISLPKMGVVNLHSAILPDYKGILGTLHALNAGEKYIGCTVHTIIDAGIDTGNLIAVEKMATNQSKSLFWHVAQLYTLGCQTLAKVIDTMDKGCMPDNLPQQKGEGRYFSVPGQHDFDKLNKQGYDTVNAEDYLEVLRNLLFGNLDKTIDNQLEALVYHEINNA